MRTKFARRTRGFGGRGYRPARSWIGSVTTVSATTAAPGQANILAIEAPALPAVLTSAPPEDLTILAVRGYFSTTLTLPLGAGGRVSLAMMVVDSTWTPSATWLLDSDKRMLWWKELTEGTPTQVPNPVTSQQSWFEVDIKPKVRLEDGKRLVLVQWNSGAGTAVTQVALRLLTQRAGRR